MAGGNPAPYAAPTSELDNTWILGCDPGEVVDSVLFLHNLIHVGSVRIVEISEAITPVDIPRPLKRLHYRICGPPEHWNLTVHTMKL
jgi:hypothetical protein